jgi:uncharacterized protein
MASNYPPSPIGRILPRHAATAVAEAMTDTRVVLVNGARQCGKSTLVAQIGNDHGAEWHSLDRPETRQAAEFDPAEFVQSDLPMVIDEVQRVPQLMLAIKESVDAEPGRPGHFLLTGSARVMALRTVPDALPGRMETIELWPLSQGEIDGKPDRFVDAAFSLGTKLKHKSTATRAEYAERVARGGFPEAVARDGKRRANFFKSYVADLINRDVIQLSEIERGPQMHALVRLLAARSGQLLVPGTLGAELGLSRDTVNRYLRLLELVFFIKQVPAWSRNLTTRAVSTPKVVMVDSGIAANLCGFDGAALAEFGSTLGPLLEGFVVAELHRQLTWSDQDVELYHYRTKDKVEVDVVLENRRRKVVAIEVKAATTVRAEDFSGLRHLADRLGDDLIVGLVLYTGEDTLPFGPRFRAMPISALWETAP